jgi:ABC-type sugar transport system substrate-binding protein
MKLTATVSKSIALAAVLSGSLATAVMPCGCGGSSSKAQTLKIAWIPKEQNNQVFQTGLDGARSRAQALSQSTGNSIQILYDELNIPATAADIAGEIASVQTAIDLGANAITLSCSDPTVSSKVDEAVRAGIPVMTFDGDCLEPTTGNPSLRFAYFGIDCYATGQTVTTLAYDTLINGQTPKPWNVGILSGVPLSSNLQQRVAGMWLIMKQQGVCSYRVDASGVNWALRKCWKNGAVDTTDDPNDGAQITYHVFEDQPTVCPTSNPFDTIDGDACATQYCYNAATNTGMESSTCAPIMNTLTTQARAVNGGQAVQIDAFLLVGLWPLIGYTDNTQATAGNLADWTARMAAGNLVTVTYDTLPFQLQMLSENYLNALVGQKYWAWGYDVIDMVYNELQGTQRYSGFIDSGADVVCSNNVAAMSEKWTSEDFNSTLPACGLPH